MRSQTRSQARSDHTPDDRSDHKSDSTRSDQTRPVTPDSDHTKPDWTRPRRTWPAGRAGRHAARPPVARLGGTTRTLLLSTGLSTRQVTAPGWFFLDLSQRGRERERERERETCQGRGSGARGGPLTPEPLLILHRRVPVANTAVGIDTRTVPHARRHPFHTSSETLTEL